MAHPLSSLRRDAASTKYQVHLAADARVAE